VQAAICKDIRTIRMQTIPDAGPRADERVCYTILASPFGPVCVAGATTGLMRVDFQHGDRPVRPAATWQEDPEHLETAVHQLREYFQGQRQSFTLPLTPPGTPFQQRVWQELQRIPFGTTLTYRQLAERLGMPQAARAVGHANGRNPLAIVIPCHRLIGSDGQLRGYASGIALKQRLLEHEGVQLSRSYPESLPPGKTRRTRR
jgi:methylated-DNA-[protein]-cysteine S-methyltransferase